MSNKTILANDQEVQVRLCCGCGVVNVTVGPLVMKLTKEVFLRMADKMERIADDMRGNAAEGSCDLPMRLEFADQKFLA